MGEQNTVREKSAMESELNRRKFLTAGAVSLGGGAIISGSASLEAAVPQEPKAAKKAPRGKKRRVKSSIADRKPGSSMQLSLAAYSFRKQLSGTKPTMTMEQFIDYCVDQDLPATELTEYFFRSKDPAHLCALRRRAHVNGLTVSGAPCGNNFCLPPGPKRSQQITHVKRWIDNVALLGAQTIRVFAGNVQKGTTEEQARKWAIEGLKECAEYAGSKGILLALENHGGITALADGLLGLVRGVDSPWLGINLDTGNFHTRVYESLEKVAPYAVSVQVKVETREGKGPHQPTDYARIVKILENAGYRGFVALEYEAKEDPFVAIPKHLAALRAALG